MIGELISKLAHDPFNPEHNFDAAVEYERLNQTASAVSFYLRCAEYGGENSILVYTSLIKLAKCFETQNDRKHTVTNCLLQAIAYMPTRPEAYFLLSQFHEKESNWQECYTFAVMGKNCIAYNPLPVNVEYYGLYCLTFEQAVSAYWIGRFDESVTLFKELLQQDISAEYRDAIKYNLGRLNVSV